jgi:hypothetical protein
MESDKRAPPELAFAEGLEWPENVRPNADSVRAIRIVKEAVGALQNTLGQQR